MDKWFKELEAEIFHLHERNKKLSNANHELRAATTPTPLRHRSAPRPEGFINNEGRFPHFVIPHYGYKARARYVRVSPTDPTSADATMGENDDIYLFPIYATPYKHDG